MEFGSRVFGPDTFLACLRFNPYKQIPEETLNATLRVIHDLTLFSVLQAQKNLLAEDLDKTFLEFDKPNPIKLGPSTLRAGQSGPAHPVKLREGSDAEFPRQFPGQHLREINLRPHAADIGWTVSASSW